MAMAMGVCPKLVFQPVGLMSSAQRRPGAGSRKEKKELKTHCLFLLMIRSDDFLRKTFNDLSSLSWSLE
jgi:hypothetical protein